MTKRWIAALVAVVWCVAAPVSAQDREAALESKIRATESLYDKEQHAVALARLGTGASREALLGLLADDSEWNRSAAVAGLVLYQDDEVTLALLQRLETDYAVSYDIEAGLRAHATNHVGGLIAYHGQTRSPETRALLLDIVGRSGDPRAGEFLVAVVEDRGSFHRAAALTLLAEHDPRGHGDFIRGWIDDRDLQPVVLGYLVQEGTAEDLPTFLALLETERDAQTLLLCYDAVDRWGTIEQRQETYLEALLGRDENLAYGAMWTFDGVYDEAIEDALCDWTRRGASVETRFTAADQLGRRGDEDVIPSLIAVLDVQYEPLPETPFWSGVLGVLTVGILPIFEGVARRWDAREFEARKADVAAGLTRLTGQHFGTDSEGWRDWAVFEGYSVGGANLIQYLYSPYPETRERAVRSACSVLGYRNVHGYYQQHPEAAGQDESVLLVALTEELLQNGLLVDEEP